MTQHDKANELSDQDLVRVAIARAMKSGAYDNAATPATAYGSKLPQREDSRADRGDCKTSNNSTNINTALAELAGEPDLCRSFTGKDLSSSRQPAQAHAMVPIVGLLETNLSSPKQKQLRAALGSTQKYASSWKQARWQPLPPPYTSPPTAALDRTITGHGRRRGQTTSVPRMSCSTTV